METRIKLRFPFTSPSTKVLVEEVVVRGPVLVGDYRAATSAAAGKAGEDRTFQLVQRMTGLITAELELMVMDDYHDLVEALNFGEKDPDPKAQAKTSTS